MNRFLVFSALLTSVCLASSAAAATFKAGESVTLPEAVEDDLYAAGAQLTFSEDVDGDVVAVGGDIYLKGNVGEDLTVGGGNVHITGNVADDARVGAGEVRISGTVGDDLFIGAGKVVIDDDAVIEGDLRISAGDVFIDGTVEGNLFARAGRVILNGPVGGTLDASVGDITVNGSVTEGSKIIADNITLGEDALFSGYVDYWRKGGELDFGDHLDGSQATFNQDYERKRHDKKEGKHGFAMAGFMAGLLSSLLFGATIIIVFALLTKTVFPDAAKQVKKSFWGAALHGFLFFAVTPIVCLLLMMTFVGIPFSLLIAFAYGFSVYFAKPLTALVFTRYFEMKYKQKWNTWQAIGVAILCFLALKIVGLIPVIGWLTVSAFVFAAYGGLMQIKWERWQKIR